ncbi:MAG: TIGR00725 family protein [candidate division KSB1 bacterium]|nr:TIGR00725 family protein [candidate division KSB1 bacterium]
MRPKIIGVIGGGWCDQEIANLAREVGRGIAERGGFLICGGLGGVMEAACQGAKQAGGTTIGILPGHSKKDANPYVDIVLPTGMSEARNIIIVRSSDAVIAIDGEYGTLSEISFCLKFNVPIVGLKTWDISEQIVKAETPAEAVEKAFQLASKVK